MTCCCVTGADPGFFLGGGALVSCSTSTPINHIVFWGQNTSCIRKPLVISGVRGGGVRTPCTLPLDPPLPSGVQILKLGNKRLIWMNYYLLQRKRKKLGIPLLLFCSEILCIELFVLQTWMGFWIFLFPQLF